MTRPCCVFPVTFRLLRLASVVQRVLKTSSSPPPSVLISVRTLSHFGKDLGVTLADGPMQHLLARAVIVVDAEGKVTYTQLVDEITTEPDYDAALEATSKA